MHDKKKELIRAVNDGHKAKQLLDLINIIYEMRNLDNFCGDFRISAQRIELVFSNLPTKHMDIYHFDIFKEVKEVINKKLTDIINEQYEELIK